MSATISSRRISILGGTGPQGRGLAARLAIGGHTVTIGSRSARRAREAVAELPDGTPRSRVYGDANLDAASWAEIVIVAVPHAGLTALTETVGGALDDKPVLCCINPLTFDAQGPVPVHAPQGSAAQDLATACPGARVVSAFQNLSARKLAAVDRPLAGDVLLCGDDPESLSVASDLVRSMPNLRPVYAGPLRLSGVVEHLTVVLLSINRRYGALTSVIIDGIDTTSLEEPESARDVA